MIRNKTWIAVGGILALATMLGCSLLPRLSIVERFQEIVKSTDRIILRDWVSPTEVSEMVVTNRIDIQRFNSMIVFEGPYEWEHCACGGGPLITWYKGNRQILDASFHHGHNMSLGDDFKQFCLTENSASNLVDWCVLNGIKGVYEELRELKDKQRSQPSVRGDGKPAPQP